jgi:putative endonuclease
MPGATIYILLCADGSYYTGITRRDAEQRESEHQLGADPHCYTFKRRPVRLVHSESYERIDEAIAAERRIKGWSRAKKEAYMRGEYERLPELSRRGHLRTLSGRRPMLRGCCAPPQHEGVGGGSHWANRFRHALPSS